MSETIENLKKAVRDYNNEAAVEWAKQAMEEGIEPIEALDALSEVIREVGDAFRRGDLFLPDLVGASSALRSATPIIEERLRAHEGERKKLGTVVIGTVLGDIHSIGKDMVSSLAIAQGFEVIDLGVDVTPERFIESLEQSKADILAMSALLTTTAYVQQEVMEKISSANLRDKIKIAVGGGAITTEFAESIGADGYRPTAIGAVELFRSFMETK
jgi:methanogenic corrinoid protein MtbC1